MLFLIGTTLAFVLLEWPWRLAVIGLLAVIEALEIALWLKLRRQRARTGEEGLIGARGTAVTDLDPDGRVRLRGALWTARAEGSIEAGREVEVTEVHGLRLTVRRAPARAGVRSRGGG